MKNSGIQFNFMKLAFMNSSNLFQIRHQCFKQLRDKQYEQSLDNMKHFLSFFEINPQSTSPLTTHHTVSYEMLQANKFLASFKTILPTYVVKSPHLQEEIMVATMNPNFVHPIVNRGGDGTDYFRHQTILDDFVFATNDTIATLLLINYCQDREISFYHNSTQKMEERWQAR